MTSARQIFVGTHGKKLPYDAEVEYLGMNLQSQKQYLMFQTIPGFDSNEIGQSDVVMLCLRSAFTKPQSGRNFIASLGIDEYFHYVEIRESQIGGYAYGRPIALFDYEDGEPIRIAMQVSAGSFDVTFQIAGEDMVMHYGEPSKRVAPATIGCLLGVALNYSAAKQLLMEASFEVNGVTAWDAYSVRFTNEMGQAEGAMYDRVSGQLFRNAGKGAFTVGPDKTANLNGGGKCLTYLQQSLLRHVRVRTAGLWKEAA